MHLTVLNIWIAMHFLFSSSQKPKDLDSLLRNFNHVDVSSNWILLFDMNVSLKETTHVFEVHHLSSDFGLDENSSQSTLNENTK